ncbi:hypothetical protein D5018_15760 [Parashewanella curva]|uniref:Uncharacterized protein n=1 Tax=Parashewanella curva TaxID=2338552 RepID=A0A3L8PTU6_9GAMM|nr:hypothetical protein [Parashewanella curva]RLV58714.1 hypothetical protein D5018_15760 [Parashewanella curva]
MIYLAKNPKAANKSSFSELKLKHAPHFKVLNGAKILNGVTKSIIQLSVKNNGMFYTKKQQDFLVSMFYVNHYHKWINEECSFEAFTDGNMITDAWLINTRELICKIYKSDNILYDIASNLRMSNV